MGMARSTYCDRPEHPADDTAIVEAMFEVCDEFESYGYRRVGAALLLTTFGPSCRAQAARFIGLIASANAVMVTCDEIWLSRFQLRELRLFSPSPSDTGMYSTNLGDYMQTLGVRSAYRRLGIPDEETVAIDRDTLSTYDGEPVVLPMNACFSDWAFPLSRVDNGTFSLDPDGIELDDTDAARVEAVRAAAEMINQARESFWEHGTPWNMHVTDGERRLLFTLQFAANVSSGAEALRPSSTRPTISCPVQSAASAMTPVIFIR